MHYRKLSNLQKYLTGKCDWKREHLCLLRLFLPLAEIQKAKEYDL